MAWLEDRRSGEWWPVEIFPSPQKLLHGLRGALRGQVLKLRGFVAPHAGHHDRGVLVPDGDRGVAKKLPKQPFKEAGLLGALLAHEDQRGVRLASRLKRSSDGGDQKPSHHGRLHLSGLEDPQHFAEQLAHSVPARLPSDGLQIVLHRAVHAPRGHRVQRGFGHDLAGVKPVRIPQPLAQVRGPRSLLELRALDLHHAAQRGTLQACIARVRSEDCHDVRIRRFDGALLRLCQPRQDRGPLLSHGLSACGLSRGALLGPELVLRDLDGALQIPDMLAHPAGGFRSADPRGPLHFVGLSDLHQQVHRAGELADQLEPLRPRRGLIVQHGQRPRQKLTPLVQLRGRHGLVQHVDVRGVQLWPGLGTRGPDDRGLRALGDTERELLAVAQSVPHRPPDLAGWLAAALAGGDQLGLRVMD